LIRFYLVLVMVVMMMVMRSRGRRKDGEEVEEDIGGKSIDLAGLPSITSPRVGLGLP